MFIAVGAPGQTNLDVFLRKVYELYADYVLKNPFYSLEMPIRCGGGAGVVCLTGVRFYIVLRRLLACVHYVLVAGGCSGMTLLSRSFSMAGASSLIFT